MVSYSSNANVQNLVYGTTNTDLDTVCANARDIATSIINAKLGLKTDLSIVPDMITRCATLLAAAFITTGPDESIENNGYYKAGMMLLENLGDEAEQGTQYNTILIDGFGRNSDYTINSNLFY